MKSRCRQTRRCGGTRASACSLTSPASRTCHQRRSRWRAAGRRCWAASRCRRAQRWTRAVGTEGQTWNGSCSDCVFMTANSNCHCPFMIPAVSSSSARSVGKSESLLAALTHSAGRGAPDARPPPPANGECRHACGPALVLSTPPGSRCTSAQYLRAAGIRAASRPRALQLLLAGGAGGHRPHQRRPLCSSVQGPTRYPAPVSSASYVFYPFAPRQWGGRPRQGSCLHHSPRPHVTRAPVLARYRNDRGQVGVSPSEPPPNCSTA